MTKKISRGLPLTINKNLGSAQLTGVNELTKTNAEGTPVVPLSEKQKYDFDRNGWLLIPGLLSQSEVAQMRSHCERLVHDPESIPELERNSMSGPLQKLIDHPVVVGFLNEFLAYPPCTSEDSYGFRMETSALMHRSVAQNVHQPFSPHNGNGLLRPPWDSHYYRCIPGKAWSGLTRVLWELNPVRYRSGGTLFITGSHKSAYPVPDSARLDEGSPLWDSYSCPPGSVIFFTESISHSSTTWADREYERYAIFNLYNSLNHRWSSWLPDPALLSQMAPKRRSLFRDVWVNENVDNGQFDERLSPTTEVDE